MGRTGAIAARRPFDRLALRLALLLSAALLPLGILAVVTGLESRRTDIHSAERALVSLTADSEAGRRALVESALTTARALAQPTLERLDDVEACSALMAETVRRSGVYSFAGFTETDGRMRCVSSGEAHDFSGSEVFRRVVAERRPLVRRSEAGASTGEPVLIATLPAFDEGILRGFLSVAISLESFAWLRWDEADSAMLRPILFNRLGEILAPGATYAAADGADDDARAATADLLPAGMTLADLARSGRGTVFSGRTAAGDRAVFAVAELVAGQLYVLGVWDPDAGPAAARGVGRWPVVFPLVMWLASLGVIYVALYHLVIRHLRLLGRQMRRFALGDRTLPQPLHPEVSQELREVHATFCKMALLLARDEADLSVALAEKDEALRERTVLLREVHHRVKNNLQLIASILNLQMRRLDAPEARKVLQNVQDRVIGLAAIHRNLYQSEHLSRLRADHLIEELLRHLFAVGADSGQGIDLRTDLAPVTLPADQLVPLSLLLTEAVTNGLKYLGPAEAGGRPWFRVGLQLEGDEVTLRVANSLGPHEAAAPQEDGASSTGLGRELIDAFALQLGARLDQGPSGAHGSASWELRLTFPFPDPAPSADANAPAATPDATSDAPEPTPPQDTASAR